jgi:hypothetical protein
MKTRRGVARLTSVLAVTAEMPGLTDKRRGPAAAAADPVSQPGAVAARS